MKGQSHACLCSLRPHCRQVLTFVPQIGGFDLIPALLDLELDLSPSVRAQTAALVGALVQNNPPCQAFLIAHMPPVFRQLLRMADLSSEPEAVRLKALFAISCEPRAFPARLCNLS